MPDKIEGLKFDVSKVTARDMKVFFKATQTNDNDALAGFFAKVVTECPPKWGKADDAETYMNLPYFGEFKGVLSAFVDEVSGKN